MWLDSAARHSELHSEIPKSPKNYTQVGDFRPSLSQRMSDNMLSSDGSSFGTTRWAAPELIQAQRTQTLVQFTPGLDVYSFGVVMWEVAARRTLPFFELSFDNQVEMAILQGQRPTLAEELEVPEEWVALMKACWGHKAADRPGMSVVLEQLKQVQLPLQDLGKPKKKEKKSKLTDAEKREKKFRSEERKARKARKVAKGLTSDSNMTR